MQPSEIHCSKSIPTRSGVGLKPTHYEHILNTLPNVGFFEIHAENYMSAGGPPHRYLTRIRELYPLSLHGVGLSIGAAQSLNKAHLHRLKALIDRYEPSLFSEHLAWSTHGDAFYNDLLPVPYTGETLRRVTEHIDEVQSVTGTQMLLENPSTYVAFEESTWWEADFISEVARRTGCGLLLDVNNAYISCTNQQWDMRRYIDSFPLAYVREIHLAGHTRDIDESGSPLLIDTHDRAIDEIVWGLFGRVVASLGPKPTLIEWDANIPSWRELEAEALMADALMGAIKELTYHAAVG